MFDRFCFGDNPTCFIQAPLSFLLQLFFIKPTLKTTSGIPKLWLYTLLAKPKSARFLFRIRIVLTINPFWTSVEIARTRRIIQQFLCRFSPFPLNPQPKHSEALRVKRVSECWIIAYSRVHAVTVDKWAV
jgi:hypothetical protein